MRRKMKDKKNPIAAAANQFNAPASGNISSNPFSAGKIDIAKIKYPADLLGITIREHYILSCYLSSFLSRKLRPKMLGEFTIWRRGHTPQNTQPNPAIRRYVQIRQDRQCKSIINPRSQKHENPRRSVGLGMKGNPVMSFRIAPHDEHKPSSWQSQTKSVRVSAFRRPSSGASSDSATRLWLGCWPSTRRGVHLSHQARGRNPWPDVSCCYLRVTEELVSSLIFTSPPRRAVFWG